MYQTTTPRSFSLERRPTSRFVKNRTRLALEHLEDRVVLDVGDTIATALDTLLGPDPGTYTLASELLGDGSFGDRDVDIYQVRATAGSSLTARTTGSCSGGDTDTILRAFTATGTQLAVDDDGGGGLCSLITVSFTTSGDFFVGVSGYPNFSYNPNTGGSGSAGSTGEYGVTMTLQGPPPPGSGVLHFTDFTLRNDPYLPAYAALGITPTIATSYADFNARLAAGGWDLAVLNQQNLSDPSWITPMADWVASGGRAIATTWIVNANPAEAQRAAAIFGGSFTGVVNQTSVSQTVGHPIWEGISDPLALSNPGWGVFSAGMTATTAASIGSYPNGNAALLVGNDNRTVFNSFVSDTPDNETERTLIAQNEVAFVLGSAPDAGPRILRHTPLVEVETISSIRVTFSRAINPDTFTTDDVSDFEGPSGPIKATGVTPVGTAGTQFDVSFPLQDIPGSYTMTLGPDILDTMDNPMDQDRDGETGEFEDRYIAGFDLVAGPRVLHFVDQTPRSDPYLAAYAALGITPTIVTSYPDFLTRIAEGSWGLVVHIQQNFSDLSTYTALGDYIAGGGRAIGATWIVNFNPAEANRFAGFFEAQYSGGVNFASISTSDHPVWNGVSDPTPLSNPGWGVYAAGLEAIGGGTSIGTFNPGGSSAAVVGNEGRTIINGFLTDAPSSTADREQIALNELIFLFGLGPMPSFGGGQSEDPLADSGLALALSVTSRPEGLVNVSGVNSVALPVSQSTPAQFDFARTELNRDAVLELISAKTARQPRGELFTLGLSSL